jgi:archaeal flagellar protein FlaI
MLFKENSKPYSYEISHEGGENVLYINYLGVPLVPSLETSGEVMAHTLSILSEEKGISRIVFVQQRNYSYGASQVKALVEVVHLKERLLNSENLLGNEKLSILGFSYEKAYSFLNYLFNELLTYDPVRAYRELKGEYYSQKASLGKGGDNEEYVWMLEKLIGYFEELTLVKKLKPYLEQYEIGSRGIYSEFFKENIMPNFTFTQMVSSLPSNAEILEQYEIGEKESKSVVTILRVPDQSKPVYHLSLPEYNLAEDHHMLLNLARGVLVEHKPSKEEFNDSERVRQVFFNVAKDLLTDLSSSKGIKVSYDMLTNLSEILIRYTIGFGILEVLLQDDNLQDIMINSPISVSPVYVKHNEYGECTTNLIPSAEDADSWAAKFRMLSGRALDEANPILDTSLELGVARARVAIIQNPLSPGGLAYTLRRHRDKPWTLPLFMKNKMIDGLGAGLLSFIIDGARTMLVAGTRSSGKTSLLGGLLLEIMPNNRIIVVEDTQELPINAMKNLNYDILGMKVKSALGGDSTEVSATEGIRASLRLGDSGLIVGEIRSEEAGALYEAMRVGALANVVAGTIHGGSPYSVFDRVVNDLKVPVTSFKATDLIVVVNPIKTPDGMHSHRRVLSITEVRKHWEKDPLSEGGFVDLMKYDVEKDMLVPTDDLINGDSEIIKEIAGNVRGWAGNWEAIWDNVLLRKQIKEEIVAVSKKINNTEILEAEFVVKSNNAFHKFSDEVTREKGLPLKDEVFPLWKKWFDKEIKQFS